MKRVNFWLNLFLFAVLVGLFAAVVLAEKGKPPLFSGSLTTIPPQKPPKGVKSLSAEACKDCHKNIYDEWKESQHSKAMVGPIWQTMWTVRNNPPMCVTCHAPMAQQRGKVLAGFKESGPLPLVMLDKPNFDPTLMKEGVTCAACHVRDGTVLTARKVSPEEQNKIPHPVTYDERLSQPEFCISCHVFSFPRVRMDFAACDGDKDYYAFAKGASVRFTCQSCHMPYREGVVGFDINDPSKAFPARQYRAHIHGHLARTREGLSESLELHCQAEKDSYQAGETVKAKVTVSNALAGHMAPTSCGVRAILIVVALCDEKGNEAAKKTFRIGRAFEFPSYPSETHDTRLQPEEERAFRYSGRIPKQWAGRKVSMKVTLIYYLLSPRVAQQAPYPLEKAAIPVGELTVPLTGSPDGTGRKG